MIVAAATETAFPALLKPLLDSGFSAASDIHIWWVPTGILLIFATRGIAGFIGTYSMSWIAQNVLRDVRQAMFEKFLVMPASSFDAKSSGQLISRLISEVNSVTAATTSIISTLVRDSLILLGLLAWLIWLNWQLTLVVAFIFPLLALISLAFSRRMRKLSRGALGATGEMTRIVEEVIFGNRIVKIFQGADYESNRFKKASARYRGRVMRLMAAQALQTPLSQLVAAIGVAAVVTIALIQSRSGMATVGDFVSFVAAMLMMFGPLRHLADLNAQLQRGIVAAQVVFDLLDEDSESDAGKIEKVNLKGKIHFDCVSLSYSGTRTEALSNISLTIYPGETVAFVGPSGGGKTSLVNLIPRLYEPSQGTILLDDRPLKDLKLGALRSQIALVSQDIVLFNDTIFNNIAYGFPSATRASVEAAIQAANLESFVATLPRGLDTEIGDRGVRISGGQRQRLAIARATLKDAPILILDEATSALDSESERNVQFALENLRKGRTTLVIAHRLETIRDVDRIMVLEGGRVVQEGKHANLILQDGVYKKLYYLNKVNSEQ